MRAVVAPSRGTPDVLRVDDVRQPVAGDGQVLIQVVSAGINFSDIQAVAGHYVTAPNPPWTPGHEVAGIDVATGEPVIAYVPFGGYAEYTLADRGFTFPASGLDLEQAGGQVLTPIAAMLSLRDAARLREGETLIITAAAGGIGSAAIQAGRILGAGKVVAIASTPEKRAFALAQGADEAIGYDDPVPAADVLFDTVGASEGYEQRLEALRQFGRVMVMGSSGGTEPPVPPNAWLKDRNVTAVVFSWGALRRAEPQVAKERAEGVAVLVREGTLRPPVERVVTLEQAGDAYRAILARETIGKVVFHPRKNGS